MFRKIKLINGNKVIGIACMALVIYGSLMIMSAEMGNAVGDNEYLSSEAIKQIGFALFGVACYWLASNIRWMKLSKYVYYAFYFVILILLIITRFWGAVGGAYAWIRLGSISIQPSEFAKTFLILFGAKLLGNEKAIHFKKNYYTYIILSLLYVFIVLLWQSDLGSACVIFIIAYFICLVPANKEVITIQRILFVLVIVGIIGILFLMSPFVTEKLMDYADNYKVGRFLAAANPFLFQYDQGYHLIMSLVSFAQGGLLGLGYGQSIHKYMNFPNPSSDFILAVVVEELGFLGFLLLIVLYGCILLPLIYHSKKTNVISSKIIFLGIFLYFVVHFILNAGGVSGLIPLTGVPLLIMSAGGSSLLSCLWALGIGQSEIEGIKNHENHSR